MKSVKTMKREISATESEIASLYKSLDFRKSDYKKVLSGIKKQKKKLETLKSLLPYLESAPSEEFVLAQIAAVKDKIERRMATLASIEGESERARKKRWTAELKELGVPALKVWLNNLNQLLDNA